MDVVGEGCFAQAEPLWQCRTSDASTKLFCKSYFKKKSGQLYVFPSIKFLYGINLYYLVHLLSILCLKSLLELVGEREFLVLCLVSSVRFLLLLGALMKPDFHWKLQDWYTCFIRLVLQRTLCTIFSWVWCTLLIREKQWSFLEWYSIFKPYTLLCQLFFKLFFYSSIKR